MEWTPQLLASFVVGVPAAVLFIFWKEAKRG